MGWRNRGSWASVVRVRESLRSAAARPPRIPVLGRREHPTQQLSRLRLRERAGLRDRLPARRLEQLRAGRAGAEGVDGGRAGHARVYLSA